MYEPPRWPQPLVMCRMLCTDLPLFFGVTVLSTGEFIAAAETSRGDGITAGYSLDPIALGARHTIHPRAVVEERAKTVLVVANPEDAQSSALFRVNVSSRTSVRIGSLPHRVHDEVSVDLSRDGCTLFYTRAPNLISRFDVCTTHALSDFAVLREGSAEEIRILPDGGLLAAARTAIFRFDARGTMIGQYAPRPLEDFRAIAIGHDGRSFWTASGTTKSDLYRFDLESGDELQRVEWVFNTPIERLSIKGEPRAALAAVAAPLFSPASLIVLTFVLALAAVRAVP